MGALQKRTHSASEDKPCPHWVSKMAVLWFKAQIARAQSRAPILWRKEVVLNTEVVIPKESQRDLSVMCVLVE